MIDTNTFISNVLVGRIIGLGYANSSVIMSLVQRIVLILNIVLSLLLFFVQNSTSKKIVVHWNHLVIELVF